MSQRSDISQSIQTSFPNNTSQFITPAILRNEQGLFEQYVILNEQTASIIAQAVASSSAGNVTSTTFNAYSASTNAFTGSIQTQVNALRAATSSYVTNAQTASMSVLSASYASSSTSASYALTASFALNAGTTVDTGSLATTGSNTFTGIQIMDSGSGITFGGNSNLSINNGAKIYDGFGNTGSIGQILSPSGSRYVWQNQTTGSTIDTGSLTTTASFNAYTASTNTFTGSIQTQVNTLQSATASYVTSAITASSLVTASVALNTITFTKGDASTFAVTVDTGSGGGMNLGANTFTGSQTLSSSTIPTSLKFNVSGALSSFVTESNAISSTNTGYGNIIFNARTTVTNTGSVIISGSSNIVFDAGTTLTTPRGLNGLQNIGFAPVYSGSIPQFSQNYNAGTVTVSGSKVAIIGNNIAGTVTITENNVSSASITQNVINGSQVVITTTYSGSTGAFGNTLGQNNINGNQHLIQIIGSGSQNRQFIGNTIGGTANTASLTTATGSSNNSGSLLNTLIYGVGLVVSGTQINTSTLHGGAFVGRFNETGSFASAKDYVYVVGAGTSATARRTSFAVSSSGLTLIRSGAELSGSIDTTAAITVVGTGSIENRIHTKQSGAIAAGAISSSAFISPEIGLEPTAANFKVILERNLTASIGQSGSYGFSLDFVNNVLVAGGTDSYIGLGKISGYCLPGKGATAATASIQNYLNNDVSMLPTLSSSYNGTLYQVWAKHQGGASSSFAYTGTEFYHSGSTQ